MSSDDVSSDAIPNDAIPNDAAPNDAAPNDAAPNDAAPSGDVPDSAAWTSHDPNGCLDRVKAVAGAVCDVAEARATRAASMWQTLGPLVAAGVNQLVSQQTGDAVRVAAAAGLRVDDTLPARVGAAAGRAVTSAGEAWVSSTREAARWAALWRP